ncbi:uncharacterized protein LOC143537156 [Bidens hawaiensis]|uniref:uncharacterized protein LOC143537156 n=1 Tax=Bidens hawaiensis TaxID=980011 RepID=UPI00404A6390
MKPPSMYELSVPLPLKEVKDVDNQINEHKKEWAIKRFSILSNGWRDSVVQKDIINFMVNSPKGLVFLKSIDVSDVSKDATLLCGVLDKMVEEVGEENVVRIVTDKASAYKLAGKMLQQKRKHIYWTPCAAQCIDLMLEDIGKQIIIIIIYQNAEEIFGKEMAIKQRKTKAPAEWWALYGSSTPILRRFTIKVLSLTCSATSCERNWGVFQHLHTKKRNSLAQEKLRNLVYVKFNRDCDCRHKKEGTADPILPEEIDESNEWLMGRMEDDVKGNQNNDDLVFDGDDLTFGVVGEASGGT